MKKIRSPLAFIALILRSPPLLSPLLSLVLLLPTSPSLAQEPQDSRWYNTTQVQQGAVLFANHCAVCHGDKAQSTVANWREPLSDGSFPPPPLDGSAHAFHHSLRALLQTIDIGGTYSGGQMPPFEDVFDTAQKRSLIAWFQSLWSDAIYTQWLEAG